MATIFGCCVDHCRSCFRFVSTFLQQILQEPKLTPYVSGVIPIGNHHHHSSGNKNVWYSVVIFTASVVPMGLSSVLKEKFFKKNLVDVFLLTACVSWSQLALTWVFVPLLSLKDFGYILRERERYERESNLQNCFSAVVVLQ